MIPQQTNELQVLSEQFEFKIVSKVVDKPSMNKEFYLKGGSRESLYPLILNYLRQNQPSLFSKKPASIFIEPFSNGRCIQIFTETDWIFIEILYKT